MGGAECAVHDLLHGHAGAGGQRVMGGQSGACGASPPAFPTSSRRLSALVQAPAVHLECGHTFHHGCVRTLLETRWNGPRISFGFRMCPLCKTQPVRHPALADLTDKLDALEEVRQELAFPPPSSNVYVSPGLFCLPLQVVRRKALLRLQYENRDKAPEVTTPGAAYYGRPADYAMHKFAYYECFKCKASTGGNEGISGMIPARSRHGLLFHAVLSPLQTPYYGGEAACGDGVPERWSPEELICTSCMPHSADADCPKHGKDFIVSGEAGRTGGCSHCERLPPLALPPGRRTSASSAAPRPCSSASARLTSARR